MMLRVTAAALVLLPAAAFAAGAVTEEGGRSLALQKEPGQVVKTVITKTETTLIYEFFIRAKNGNLVEVTVNGRNGAITGHEIVKMATDAPLPKALVKEGDAKALAIRHAQEESASARKPVITDMEYKVMDGRPVYRIELKQGFDASTVYIDAQTGAVTSPGENIPQERGRGFP